MIVQHKATGKVGVIPQNEPIPDGCEAVENRESTSENEAAPPDRWGPYWLHPDGFYRLFPPNDKTKAPQCSGAERR